MRLFVEWFFAGSMSVYVYGDVERPAPAATPVGNFDCVSSGSFRLRLAGAEQLRAS
jgi:hypothetical protein